MSKQEPAAYQYRWLNPSGENHPASMLEWKPCEPKDPGQTLEECIEELRGYVFDGKPQYEVRALYADPVVPRQLKTLAAFARSLGQHPSVNVDDLMMIINQNLFGGEEKMRSALSAYLAGDPNQPQP